MQSHADRVLVAGVGNIFLGDDGFGPEVLKVLADGRFPDGVVCSDFGIRGVHLAYELLEGYDTLVLVDAVSTGEPPGTVSLFEHDVSSQPPAPSSVPMDSHSMQPEAVLAAALALGARPRRVLVVGCEAEDVSEGIGLSPPVAAAVPVAVSAVEKLLQDVLAAQPGPV